MCGIAGWVRIDAAAADPSPLAAMVASMQHRGPDDGGEVTWGPVAMGMRRLSIVDLSPLGHQPMASPDGEVELVFNGEIYNHLDLRSQLVALGFDFKSRSDTEVLLHGYRAWGLHGLLKKLEGMFAIALLDRKTHELHLARDPFGIKPMYLRRGPGQLSFASELRTLALDGLGPLALDTSFVPSFLRLGWIPSPRTPYRGVSKLDAGTTLTVALTSGEVTGGRYYQLKPAALESEQGEALSDALRAKLELAVRRQLVADVPVAVFLSGGLDSSTIASIASHHAGGQLKTFSVGFRHSDRGDELPAAALVARAIHSTQTEVHVDPGAFFDMAPIVESIEEPIADTAVIPLWHLCRETAKHVKVALSGEGGDEALGGYPRYFWGMVADALGDAAHALPRSAALQALAGHLPSRTRGVWNVWRRATKLMHATGLPEAERYLSFFDVFSRSEREALHPGREDHALERVQDSFSRGHALGLGPMERMQLVDVENMMVDNLLTKSDKISMAHSLEVRVPLLERGIVEFGLGLPLWAKIGPREDKKLLRKLVRETLLPAIARLPKRGFELPVDHWLRTPEGDRALSTLATGALVERLGFSSGAIGVLAARHARGEDVGRKLFALWTLEAWAKRYAS
jgi:asparagine synthase (glutamine-hydrolysing)